MKMPSGDFSTAKGVTMAEVPEAGVRRYLLVGFTCRGLPDEHKNLSPDQKKQQPVGTSVSPNSTIEPSELPIMVVTPIQEVEQPKIDLFALLGPRAGLCTPYQIGQKATFYLSQFRDGTTDKKLRGPQWNKLVAKYALRPSETQLSAKQIQ
ncbi:hypothetical protein B7494_g1098 [Chlorociboria aeruginascens]|nr:hypothetical protein B7494_g1098 [Chlorociboria aeruginascens]